MKKYLVDVFCPSVGCHYDAYLPSNKRIREVTQLLVKLAGSLSDGAYQSTENAMLLLAENGRRLDPELTVKDSGIRNASHLILV